METVIIGIAGPSASGKTLLANTIVNELESSDVAIISEDCYYKDRSHLSDEKRSHINYDHPDSFDHALFCEQLRALQAGQSVEVPQYDYSTHTRSPKTRTIDHHAIIVLEGILLFVETELRDLMNMCIFMDTPLDLCLARRLKRDVLERERAFESVLEQYEATVRPMYLQFIEPSKRYADIIIPQGGTNRIAIDVIKATIKDLLGGFQHGTTTTR